MNTELVKIYKSIHTWTGITTSLLLYICFLAASFTMFKGTLNQWVIQDEEVLPSIAKENYDSLIQQVFSEHKKQKSITVKLPNSYPQTAPVSWMVEDERTHKITHMHASLDKHGQLITSSTSSSDVGDFFDHIHRTAGIPGGTGHDALGTYVMGVVAALYFLAIISGLIVFLPTWFKDLFTLRKGENRKRFWLDFHNVLGISSLPFHLVIALTAFVFAYHDPIYDAMQEWIYDEQPMFERGTAVDIKPLSELASIATLEQSLHRIEPNIQIEEMQFMRLGTPGAMVRMGGVMDGEITRGAKYIYTASNPFTGEVTQTKMLPNQGGAYSKFVFSMFTLHVGSYGGNFIRWVYFFLALTGSVIFITGNILWIEARQRKAHKNQPTIRQKKSNIIMARLTVGIAVGTLLGIMMALIAAKHLPHTQHDILFWQKTMYYIGFIGAMIWAFIRKPIIAAKELTLASLVFSVMLFFNALIENILMETTLMFFILLCILGGVLYWLLQRTKLMPESSVWLGSK